VATTVIIGAGNLGSAIARQLAAADVVSTIMLVDDDENAAAGKALDICQAGPIDGYVTALSATSSLDAAIGAQFVVLADRCAQSLEWQDDAAVGLIARIASLNQTAPIVCAGAAQASTIERAVRDFGIARRQLFGTAPEALRSAVVALAALEAQCTPADVNLSVLGLPPHQVIVPWEDASIAGRRATSVLPPPALARLESRLPRLWPPGPVTLASAATRAIRAAASRTPHTISAFVSITREEGAVGRVGMLPVQLTRHGIGSVATPALSRRDQVRLETALS
jgi:hypothetical protein